MFCFGAALLKKFGPGPIGAKTICQEFRKFEISRNAAVSMVRFSHLTQDRRSVNIHKKSNPWGKKTQDQNLMTQDTNQTQRKDKEYKQ